MLSFRYVALVALAAILIAALVAVGQDVEHVPPAVPTTPELVTEAREFFRQGRETAIAARETFASIERGVYFAGMKDGALAAAAALVLGYVMFVRRTPPPPA